MTTLPNQCGDLLKDQVAPIQAANWKENIATEKTFNLEISRILLQKNTFDILSKGNQNWIRVKLGLEEVDGKLTICAFAQASVLDGRCPTSYVDLPYPIYKLGEENIDFSNRITEVNASLTRWESWRNGEIGDGEDAPARKYIYPISYLLTKPALNQIFNYQQKDTALLNFGIVKTMTVMIYSNIAAQSDNDDPIGDIFDYSQICPPYC
jgi:hypothetical protein